MHNIIDIGIFVEDKMQEEFLRYIIKRLCSEYNVINEIISISKGHGKGGVQDEVKNLFKLYKKGNVFKVPKKLMVICIDTNCDPVNDTVKQIKANVINGVIPRITYACPYPHIEKWYLNDLDCWYNVVGHRPDVPQKKCKKAFYKNILSNSIAEGGHPPGSSGEDFAKEIAEQMDFIKAGKDDNSFKHFIDDLKNQLKQIKLDSSKIENPQNPHRQPW